MKNIFRFFVPYDKLEITTQMSKDEILKTVESIPHSINEDYRVKTYDDGFSVAEKVYKGGLMGTRNSFVPVGKAKIHEKDDLCVVSVSLRLLLYVQIFNYIFLLLSSFGFLIGVMGIVSSCVSAFNDMELLKFSVACLCFLPLYMLLVNFAFRRPAKRMKELLTSLLERE